MKLLYESAMLPLKWVKEDLLTFHQNVGRLSVFWKNVFPFSDVVPFGYNNTANEGTLRFFRWNLGQFPHLPKNGGWGDKSNHRILELSHVPQLFVTYPQAICSLVLRSNWANKKGEKKKKWVTEVKQSRSIYYIERTNTPLQYWRRTATSLLPTTE